jgi:hypothetical protein
MKKTSTPVRSNPTPPPPAPAPTPAKGIIHPVIIYPFRQPTDTTDLEELYKLVARLDADKTTYARPITVMDRKTFYAAQWSKPFLDFRKNTVAGCSDILDAWCVDTCQMWYTGLGAASETGNDNDIYWLIPGDFSYGNDVGKEVLSHLHDLPEIIAELNDDVCIGEITSGHNDHKQLIDVYGTFALLYHWFPEVAQDIRKVTERPRSEFLALRHGFLRETMLQRWYPYEQTLVILLTAVLNNKKISRFSVGDITDLPQGKETLDSALQQVERTERVLKMLWRERNQGSKDWIDSFHRMEQESEQVRRTAMIILQNVLV